MSDRSDQTTRPPRIWLQPEEGADWDTGAMWCKDPVWEGATEYVRADLAAADHGRMEEALHRIASWAEAYPLEVFPEPDKAYYAKANEVLTANGMTLDRLSAAAMRHVITQVGKIAKDALA